MDAVHDAVLGALAEQPTRSRLRSTDKKGNVETGNVVAFNVFDLETPVGGVAGGAVPATLSLTLGSAAAFGAFVPGVDREYNATTSANVVSTAGDAALTVSDPSTADRGRLVNGTFASTDPLRGYARRAAPARARPRSPRSARGSGC